MLCIDTVKPLDPNILAISIISILAFLFQVTAPSCGYPVSFFILAISIEICLSRSAKIPKLASAMYMYPILCLTDQLSSLITLS